MAAVLPKFCRLGLPIFARAPQRASSWLLGRAPICRRSPWAPVVASAGCCQPFSAQRGNFEKTAPGPGEEQQPRPKTVPKTLVTLLGPEKGALNVVQLEEAERIAKRRNLRLEKVNEADSKSKRATYKLLQHHSGVHSKRTEPTPNARISKIEHKEKQVSLNDKIEDHDLISKVKQMKKWIDKRADVRVTISGANAEKVYLVMEKELLAVGARILQKRQKGDNTKFTVAPPKEAKTVESIEDNIKTAE